MANITPIDTQTELRRISIANSSNLNQAIKDVCDDLGGAGYQLMASFEISGELILIFQLTR